MAKVPAGAAKVVGELILSGIARVAIYTVYFQGVSNGDMVQAHAFSCQKSPLVVCIYIRIYVGVYV